MRGDVSTGWRSGCINEERIHQNNNRPNTRDGAFSAMRDVGTYRPGASDMSTHRRMCPQRTDVSESQPLFNNDLYVSGNACTLNKRRTHLIGTSLHRNHFRPFNGMHAQTCGCNKITAGPYPRCMVISAMQDVGTYRQVRPLCQPTGRCIHNERLKLTAVV